MSDIDNARSALEQAVTDLEAEGEQFYRLLQRLEPQHWQQTTGFKHWTVWDVVAHLHFSDHMGMTTLRSGEAFQALMADMAGSGKPFMTYQRDWVGAMSGAELRDRWRTLFVELCAGLRAADPEDRLTWAGPGMKPRMFATARQMETWAHAWEIYDLLAERPPQSDRLKNIATIGVRTYGWTFANRQLEAPGPAPHVRLTAPSGALWEWNEPDPDNAVRGDAVEFCQVVTQVRNVADTSLEVTGEPASRWMALAQCFAGAPADPPAPGTRGPSSI